MLQGLINQPNAARVAETQNVQQSDNRVAGRYPRFCHCLSLVPSWELGLYIFGVVSLAGLNARNVIDAQSLSSSSSVALGVFDL